MRRRMMKSKIHRATVTDANLHYVGSITARRRADGAADIREYEQVAVLDIDNGARFETYVIAGDGSGDVCLNGAAARLVQPGDRVIIITYADYDEAELDELRAAHRARRHRQRPIDEHRPRSPARRPAHVATSRSTPADRQLARPSIPSPSSRAALDPIGSTDAPPDGELDLLVLGSAASPGCRPRCVPPARTAAGRRAHQGRARPGRHPLGPGRRGRGARRATPTPPTSTSPTRWPPAPGCATSTRCACSSTRARRGCNELIAARRGVRPRRRRPARAAPAKAATRWPRVVHAGGAATGAEIERALGRRRAAHARPRCYETVVRPRPDRRGRPVPRACVALRRRRRASREVRRRQRAARHRRRRPAVRGHHQPGRGHRRRHRHGAARRRGGRRRRVHAVPPDRAAPPGDAAAAAVRGAARPRRAAARRRRRALRRRAAAPRRRVAGR